MAQFTFNVSFYPTVQYEMLSSHCAFGRNTPSTFVYPNSGSLHVHDANLFSRDDGQIGRLTEDMD